MTQEEREQLRLVVDFEAWASGRGYSIAVDAKGFYTDPNMFWIWLGWEAYHLNRRVPSPSIMEPNWREDLHLTLKAVLYHFGPEGAQKVTASALEYRASPPSTPAGEAPRMQIPARDLSDTDLIEEHDYAFSRFKRGEPGGPPSEYWAERMGEIEQEQARRRAAVERADGN